MIVFFLVISDPDVTIMDGAIFLPTCDPAGVVVQNCFWFSINIWLLQSHVVQKLILKVQ